MRILLRIALLGTFILTVSGLQAQKYSNEFLTIGLSARAQAMGNAVVAGVNDVTASYWNPAGLAQAGAASGLQIGAMHAEWFAGIGKYDYIGLSLPTSNPDRRMGISFIRFGIDGIPNTLSLYEDDGTVNYDNIVEFSAADYAFLGTYSQRTNWLNGNLFLGGNIKVIYRQIGSFASSWGFGVDLGAQYRTNKWNFGLTAKDITTTFNAWKTSFTEDEQAVLIATGNDLPDINSVEITRPSVLLGAGYRIGEGNWTFYPELNFVVTTDGKRNTLIQGDPFSIDPGFGLEIGYKSLIYLRSGVNQFQREQDFDKGEILTLRPSIGLGLNISSLVIDYAFTDLGDSQNRYSHVISLRLDLKPRDKSKG
ncbi:MAG: PorV/PorQ family protein [Bacteroidetes bacterium]|nr:PorV/PorQ family protein [Bacteroidota bacterium]